MRFKALSPPKQLDSWLERPHIEDALLANLHPFVFLPQQFGTDAAVIPEVLRVVQVDEHSKRPEIARAPQASNRRIFASLSSGDQGVWQPNQILRVGCANRRIAAIRLSGNNPARLQVPQSMLYTSCQDHFLVPSKSVHYTTFVVV